MQTPRGKICFLALIFVVHTLLILYSLRATHSCISIRNTIKSQHDKSTNKLQQKNQPKKVDVLEFRVTNACPESVSWDVCAMDWSSATGIGTLKNSNTGGEENGIQFCCTDEAISEGLCLEQFRDQLKMDYSVSGGDGSTAVLRRKVVVPKSGDLSVSLHNANLFRTQGTYVVMMVNCNSKGRSVQVTGSWVFVAAEDLDNILPEEPNEPLTPTTTTAPPPSPAASPTRHSLPTRPGPSSPTLGSATTIETEPANSSSAQHSQEISSSSEDVSINPLLWPTLAVLIVATLVVVVVHRKIANSQQHAGDNKSPQTIRTQQDDSDMDDSQDFQHYPQFPSNHVHASSSQLRPIT
jgi:hypothetical protein